MSGGSHCTEAQPQLPWHPQLPARPLHKAGPQETFEFSSVCLVGLGVAKRPVELLQVKLESAGAGSSEARHPGSGYLGCPGVPIAMTCFFQGMLSEQHQSPARVGLRSLDPEPR